MCEIQGVSKIGAEGVQTISVRLVHQLKTDLWTTNLFDDREDAADVLLSDDDALDALMAVLIAVDDGDATVLKRAW